MHDPVTVGGILVSSEGIRPVSGNLATLIRPEDTQDIVLRHGLRSHHPIAQILFGAVLAAVGYWPLLHAIYWYQHGGVLIDMEVWLIVLAAFGIYFAASVVKRSFFLEVRTKRGRRKLCFAPKTERGAIKQFLDELTARGYSVSREVDLAG
jgi:hypothetical protein